MSILSKIFGNHKTDEIDGGAVVTTTSDAKRTAAEKIWSATSQADQLEIWKLQARQRELVVLISRSQKKILDCEQRGERLVKNVTPASSFSITEITDNAIELEGMKRAMAALQKEQERTQSAIEALAHPSPSQVAGRTEQQEILAGLARVRLQKDRLIDAALEQLQQLLEERSEYSSRMGEVASALSLTSGHDGFDTLRFENLLRSLPAAMSAKSAEWLEWFLGEEKGKKAYTVRRETLILPETLAAHHAHIRDECVELTNEQFNNLLSKSADALPLVMPRE